MKETSSRRPRISWMLQDGRFSDTPPSRSSCLTACGKSTSSLSKRPVSSANTPGAATDEPPPASADGSRASTGASEPRSPRYPSPVPTRNAFRSSSHCARSSTAERSSTNSPVNGDPFTRPRIPAAGVTSSPAAPPAVTLLRFGC